MNQFQRIAHVRDELLRQLDRVGITLSVQAAADWFHFMDYHNGKYGWLYPYPADEGFQMEVCPELIASQTMSLDTETLNRYLYVIAWLTDRFKQLVHGDHPGGTMVAPDYDDIQARLESELYDHDPTLLTALSRAQLAILDHAP